MRLSTNSTRALIGTRRLASIRTEASRPDDAYALREHLGIDQMVLFGHSYGSFLGQEYALSYQDRLKGLILCAAAPVIDYMDLLQQRAAARNMPEQFAALREAFSRPMDDDADFEAVWEHRTRGLFFDHHHNFGAAAWSL